MATPMPTAPVIPTTGYGNMGYSGYATPNPFTPQTKPSWMTGNFAMPTWGYDVMGRPLTAQQLSPQAPQAPQAPAQPQPAPPQQPMAQPSMASPPWQVIRDQIAWDASRNQQENTLAPMGGSSPVQRWQAQQQKFAMIPGASSGAPAQKSSLLDYVMSQLK